MKIFRLFKSYFVISLSILIGILPRLSFGQVDTEFWFAVPIIGSHGNGNAEVVVSNMSKTTAVTVNISNPAAPAGGWGIAGRDFTVLTGQSLRIDLNSLYGTQQSTPRGSLYSNLNNAQLASQLKNNNGLLIKSTGDITAFYELGRNGLNIEIFSLKGSNSLGTDFMLPFQNHYETWTGGESYSSANIIASVDNTEITIVPTRATVSGLAGVPFTIKLDKGQTYTLRAQGLAANQHLSGTTVSSTKPIAITLVDDSVDTTKDGTWGSGNTGIDMVGDQIVPLNVLGKEYIVARGLAGTDNTIGNRNKIFILTTQDNTNIKITETGASSPPPFSNLPKGNTMMYQQPTGSPASLIVSDKPIYVFYVSGSGSELGGALIPPTKCTGSNPVNIVRSATEDGFYLIILAKNKSLNTFKTYVEGVPKSLFMPSDFLKLGTQPEDFAVLNKKFSLTDIPVLKTLRIENTNANYFFHAGVAVAGSSAGSFGYFSDFNSINIGYASKPVCFGESLTLDAGAGRDKYRWFTKTNNLENIPALSNIRTYDVTTPGTQQIFLEIEKKGCVLKDSVTVYVQPKVNLSILRKKIACNNQPISMDATPDDPSIKVKFVWYSTTPTIPDVPTDTFARSQYVSAQFPVTAPNSPHKIKVKVIDDKGCISYDSVEVTINNSPPPNLAFSGAEVCSGDSIPLGITSPSIDYVYKWRDGTASTNQVKATGLNDSTISNPKASKANLTLNPTTHNYFITTVDTSTSCAQLDDLILTVNPKPKVIIAHKKLLCKDETNTPTALSDITNGKGVFSIKNEPPVVPPPATFTYLAPKKAIDTLNYTYTTAAGCKGSADSVYIVSEVPPFTLTPKAYCSGDSVTIGLSKNTDYKYLWTSLPSPTARRDTSEAKIKLKNLGSAPLTPEYELTITDKINTSCKESAKVIVTINPQPVASITDADVITKGYCISTTPLPADFGGTPAGNPTAGVFSSPEAGMIGARFTPKTEGANKVTYTVTTFGCADDTTITIPVHPLPDPKILGIDKLVYCFGETITITGDAVNPAVGSFDSPNVPNATTGSFTFTDAKTYPFKYEVTSDKGCKATVSKSVNVKALPIVLPGNPVSICVGKEATLSASGGTTYVWESLTATTSSVLVKPTVSRTYKVVAVDNDNCKSLPQTIAVTVSNTPIANFRDSIITHCFEKGTIKVSGGLAPTYLWSDGSVTETLEVTQAGNFKVTLTDGTCSTSDEVMVVAACPPRIFLPKAFSPNNDGYNDSLQVFGDHFKELKLRIFNRWGEVVFESTQQDKLWDGSYNGQPMPSGVYPWVLSYKSEIAEDKNKLYTLDGSIHIIQ